MNTYNNTELKNFFEIFKNLKPFVKNIVEIHNNALYDLEKEYKGKPFLKDEFFKYIPFDFEEFYMENDGDYIRITEVENLWGGDREYHHYHILFKWIYSENPYEVIKEKYLKDIKYYESEYNIAVEKAKERKAIEEAEKIKREKEQYELLKAKFEGEK
jgi:hypothetical protein